MQQGPICRATVVADPCGERILRGGEPVAGRVDGLSLGDQLHRCVQRQPAVESQQHPVDVTPDVLVLAVLGLDLGPHGEAFDPGARPLLCIVQRGELPAQITLDGIDREGVRMGHAEHFDHRRGQTVQLGVDVTQPCVKFLIAHGHCPPVRILRGLRGPHRAEGVRGRFRGPAGTR
jgi:hypothetical protein